MGYIDSYGKYHKEAPKFNTVVPAKTSVWKQSDHDRQRRDHKADLVRPYKPDGTPNEEFISLYPEESKTIYKFIPTDEELSKEK